MDIKTGQILLSENFTLKFWVIQIKAVPLHHSIILWKRIITFS